jgi:hypothetical protein
MALGLITRDFGHGWNFGAIVIFFSFLLALCQQKKTLSANCTKVIFRIYNLLKLNPQKLISYSTNMC